MSVEQKQPRIGFVLSSGGIRGVFAHTGFLQALNELGIPIVAGAGCSAGAIVGGIVASGTDIEDWVQSLLRVRRRDFWTPDSLWRFLWKMTVHKGTGYTGLSGTEAAQAFCRDNLAAQTFGDCRIPFYTVAISLAHSKKTVFDSGELVPRMVASAAMPLLYRPVQIEGDLYCDGAMIDLAPTDAVCCKQSLDVLIVHHVSRRSISGKQELRQAMTKPWTMVKILDRILYHHRPWYLSNKPLSFQRCPCGCDAVIVVLEPELLPMEWPLTKGGRGLLEATRSRTIELLGPYIQKLLTNPRTTLPDSEGSSG